MKVRSAGLAVSAIIISLTVLGSLTADASGTRGERHPELRKALKALQKSRSDLLKGDKDFGGHRTKAVQAIDTAIDEINQAIQFDHH